MTEQRTLDNVWQDFLKSKFKKQDLVEIILRVSKKRQEAWQLLKEQIFKLKKRNQNTWFYNLLKDCFKTEEFKYLALEVWELLDLDKEGFTSYSLAILFKS